MIHRNALSFLLNWKNKKRKKPLIIRGARQIGKTTLVDQLAKYYQHYLYFNLDEPEDRDLFEQNQSYDNLIKVLYLSRGLPLKSKNSLIFIDEIQESPNAIRQLRYFHESNLGADVIAAGSLLEHVLSQLKSFPVGRVTYLSLYPMNFVEYLRGRAKDELLNELFKIPVADYACELLFKEFHQFAILGGMPEAVASFVDTEDLNEVNEILDSILVSYKDDVIKYASNSAEADIIRHIIDNAPSEADARVTMAHFGGSSYGSKEVSAAMRSLQAAKIIRLIYPTSAVSPPIRPNLRKHPRLQFIDTGMMNYALGIQVEMMSVKDLNAFYRGKIVQHHIMQEYISSHHSPNFQPSFWIREKKTSNAEVDLLVQSGQILVPVEIKSGASGRLRSLHQYVDQAEHGFTVRLYRGKVSVQQVKTIAGKPYTLLNLPYFVGCLLDEYIDWFRIEQP